MNCNLSDQAGPGIKEEVTSPSWENREKFAASREKCFLMKDTPQKHDYIISQGSGNFEIWIGPADDDDVINEPISKKKKKKKKYVYITCHEN